jgi:uncharacterized membrane protein
VSTQRLRTAAIVIAAAGVAVAGYLTWIHYGEIDPVCVGGGGGCERVQASEYSELAGVPVALLGLVTYAAILVLLLLPRLRGVLPAAGIALVAFAFSAYLTYLELFVIDAICQWCVASAVIATALAIATCALAMRKPQASA